MAAVLPSRPRPPAAPILLPAGHDAASTSAHDPPPASISPEEHCHHLGHHSRFGWTDPLDIDQKISKQRQQQQQQQRQHQHQQHLDEIDQRASSLYVEQLDDLSRRESVRQQRRAHALQLTVTVVDSARASTDRRLSADRDATLAHATRLVDYRDPNYHDSCDAEFLRTCHEVESSSGTSTSSSSNGNGNGRGRFPKTDSGGDDVCDDDDDLLDIDLQALRTHARFGSAASQRPLAGNRGTAGAPGTDVPAAAAAAAAATADAGASCCFDAEGATSYEAAACAQLYPDLDAAAGVSDVTGDLVLLPWALEPRKTGAAAQQSSAFHDSAYEGPGQLRLRQRQHQHQHQQEHLRQHQHQHQHQQSQHGSQEQQQPVLDRSVTVPATPLDGGSAAYRHYVARTSTDTEPDSAESARLQLVAAEFRLFEVRKMLAAIKHDKSSSRHRLAGPAATAAAGSVAGCCDNDGAGIHSSDRVASDGGVLPAGDAVRRPDGGSSVDGTGGGSMRWSKSRQGGHDHPLIHHTRSASTPNPSEEIGSSLPYSSAAAAAADGCKQLTGHRSLPPLARRSGAKSRFHSPHQGMGVGSPDSTRSSVDGDGEEDDDNGVPQVVGCMLPSIFFRRKAGVNGSSRRSSRHHNSVISNSR